MLDFNTILVLVILPALKFFPEDKVKVGVAKIGYYMGVALTVLMSKYPQTGEYWNTVIEPWFISIIKMLMTALSEGLVEGLESDNTARTDEAEEDDKQE